MKGAFDLRAKSLTEHNRLPQPKHRMKKKVKQTFDFLLKDFEPNPDYIPYYIIPEEHETRDPEFIIDTGNSKIDHPYIVFIIFVYLKEYKYWPRWEKVAWIIPVKYKETSFTLSHTKFGFSIRSNTNTVATSKLAVELIGQIKKSTRLAEALIEPSIKQWVQKGNIVLDNDYERIFERYSFFYKKADQEFKKAKKIAVSTSLTPSLSTAYYKHSKNGDFLTIAMLDSYFSLIEHTFVLLLPFVQRVDFSKVDVESYMGLNWKEKFKILFDLTIDVEANQILDKLDKIKEEFRNPLSHGYFQKKTSSFLVPIEPLGAIPIKLTKDTSPRYTFSQNQARTFVEIHDTFEEGIKFLNSHPDTKYGMKYINSGLVIAYDKASRDLYAKMMGSDEMFDYFIDRQISLSDDYRNMDW